MTRKIKHELKTLIPDLRKPENADAVFIALVCATATLWVYIAPLVGSH